MHAHRGDHESTVSFIWGLPLSVCQPRYGISILTSFDCTLNNVRIVWSRRFSCMACNCFADHEWMWMMFELSYLTLCSSFQQCQLQALNPSPYLLRCLKLSIWVWLCQTKTCAMMPMVMMMQVRDVLVAQVNRYQVRVQLDENFVKLALRYPCVCKWGRQWWSWWCSNNFNWQSYLSDMWKSFFKCKWKDTRTPWTVFLLKSTDGWNVWNILQTQDAELNEKLGLLAAAESANSNVQQQQETCKPKLTCMYCAKEFTQTGSQNRHKIKRSCVLKNE